MGSKDHVDFIVEQWRAVLPELDVSSMEVFGRLLHIQKQVDKVHSEDIALYGMKEGEFDVLATLYRSGKPYVLSPTNLWRSTLISSGAMTNRLSRLENAGLIKRNEDLQDKRVMLVGLTSKGLSCIEDALISHISIQKKILKSLSIDEKKDLSKLLKKLLEYFPKEN